MVLCPLLIQGGERLKSFEINNDGDWTLGIVNDDKELIQCLKHLIYERIGEWFLNQDHGFRRGVLEEKHYSEPEIVQAIYDAMYQEPRVVEIIKVNYEFDRINRHLSIDFNLRTADGELRGDFNVDT